MVDGLGVRNIDSERVMHVTVDIRDLQTCDPWKRVGLNSPRAQLSDIIKQYILEAFGSPSEVEGNVHIQSNVQGAD